MKFHFTPFSHRDSCQKYCWNEQIVTHWHFFKDSSHSQNQDSEKQCFKNGECQSGHLLRKSTTLGKTACLNFCKRVEGCLWFTYHPTNMMCLAFSNCNDGISSTDQCPDCLSGEASCESQIKNCWSKGTCSGRLLLAVFLIFIEVSFYGS